MDGYSPFCIARGGQHWGLRERFIADLVAVPTAPPSPGSERRWASGRRQIIEQVISQLKDLFALERHRSKTLGGLLARLAAKVAAYLCGQRLDSLLGRPLRHLADLLN